MKNYDVLIIGAGQAATPLAHALAGAGRRVALAERKHLGGSCVNFGCTPTTAAFASARLAHLARRGSEFGIRVNEVRPDFAAVLARAADIAQQSRSSLQESLSGKDNPFLIRGHARFVGRDGERFRLTVGDEEIGASQVVLDTGTRSRIPDIDGLSDIDAIDAENWLSRRTLPSHLAVIGGGYIGLEMAQFYRRMGAEVSVIEHGEQIAGHEDPDVAAALQRMLENEGIRFRLGTAATRFRRRPDGVAIGLKAGDKNEELAASHVFVALGRQPNTDDLGLDAIGLHPDDKGIIETDKRLCAGIDGIWAVGDIRGGPMFTHTAWDDYRIVASQLIGDGSRTTDRVVPYAVFTGPSLGRVGITESEARKAGKRIEVAHFDMQGNGKARELGESTGLIKVVADAQTKLILGAAVLASEGAELVHIYVALMNARAPWTVLADAIQIHPTLAEAAQSALSSMEKPG
jgi:pyruvate/2-oxoglutarate dehydrogenase complex dihydrolipoamide dehydrogenase (E3) component